MCFTFRIFVLRYKKEFPPFFRTVPEAWTNLCKKLRKDKKLNLFQRFYSNKTFAAPAPQAIFRGKLDKSLRMKGVFDGDSPFRPTAGIFIRFGLHLIEEVQCPFLQGRFARLTPVSEHQGCHVVDDYQIGGDVSDRPVLTRGTLAEGEVAFPVVGEFDVE